MPTIVWQVTTASSPSIATLPHYRMYNRGSDKLSFDPLEGEF
jgi:hypothetical protein